MAKSNVAKSNNDIVVPILVLAAGIGWLLNSLEWFPDVNWAWSLCLAAGGILVLLSQGLNRGTVVLGPLLLIAGLLSIARQAEILSPKVEVPCLVIAVGVLLLISRLSNLPSGHARNDNEEGGAG